MFTLEHLFLYYLMVFVAVFAGISGIVLAVIPYITEPEEPSEYEISSLLEPKMIA